MGTVDTKKGARHAAHPLRRQNERKRGGLLLHFFAGSFDSGAGFGNGFTSSIASGVSSAFDSSSAFGSGAFNGFTGSVGCGFDVGSSRIGGGFSGVLRALRAGSERQGGSGNGERKHRLHGSSSPNMVIEGTVEGMSAAPAFGAES
jgi:hypothetical protein